MYSKAEISRTKQDFWTAFGKYLSPHLSSEGDKINWVNYKTGFKQIQFRMEADTYSASIAIEINHPDKEIQQLFFERFKGLKTLMYSSLQENWKWEENVSDEKGKLVSCIYAEIKPVNILNKADWPVIISFLKPRIIALDDFWSTAKISFEELKYL